MCQSLPVCLEGFMGGRSSGGFCWVDKADAGTSKQQENKTYLDRDGGCFWDSTANTARRKKEEGKERKEACERKEGGREITIRNLKRVDKCLIWVFGIGGALPGTREWGSPTYREMWDGCGIS